MYTVTIDSDKCEGCGECVENCPASILEMVGGKAEVKGEMEDCLGCETCVSVCGTNVVTLTEA